MSVKNVVCKGGLNTESAIFDMNPGEAVTLLNVEVDTSGTYTTMAGIEKFDGHFEPNKAVYLLVGLNGVSGISAGDNLTASSGWTAKAVGVDATNNYVGVVNTSGAINVGDTIAGHSVTSVPMAIEARSYDKHRELRSFAQSYYRALIQQVPGTGPVLGVTEYRGDFYAFRDHTDSVTAKMFKATSSGWTEITTSGLLLKGGQYRFCVHNFKASAGTKVLIIVNGVNKAVKYDGTSCVALSTGMPSDTPSSVGVLPSSVLMLGYDNGSVMTSKVGDPTDFAVASGGTELGMSDKVVGIALQPDERAAIFCEKSIRILSGKTVNTFAISVFNADAGAIPNTIINIGDSIFLSQTGLTRLSRSQNFGSFEMSSIDKKIKSLINNADSLFAIAVRRKNQYRIFNSFGFVGITLVGTDIVGAFNGSYPVKMVCGCSAEINNEEYILLGGVDGYVYRADVGQSHAGAKYSRVIRMAHNDLSSGQQRKRFKRMVINSDSERMVPVSVSAELDYSSGNAPRMTPYEISVGGNESILGSIVLGKSVLGSADDSINQIPMLGVGRAISPIINIYSNDLDPVRFGGYSIEYELRSKTR